MGQLRRFEHEAGPFRVAESPPDDAPSRLAGDVGDIEEARLGRNVVKLLTQLGLAEMP